MRRRSTLWLVSAATVLLVAAGALASYFAGGYLRERFSGPSTGADESQRHVDGIVDEGVSTNGAYAAVSVSAVTAVMPRAIGRSYVHILRQDSSQSQKIQTGGITSSPIIADGSTGFWFSSLKAESHVREVKTTWNNQTEHLTPYWSLYDKNHHAYESFKNLGRGESSSYDFPIVRIDAGATGSGSGMLVDNSSLEEFVTGVSICEGQMVAFTEANSTTPSEATPVKVYTKGAVNAAYKHAGSWLPEGTTARMEDSWHYPVCHDGRLVKLVGTMTASGHTQDMFIVQYDIASSSFSSTKIDFVDDLENVEVRPKRGRTVTVENERVYWVTTDGNILSAPIVGGSTLHHATDLSLGEHFAVRLENGRLTAVWEQNESFYYQERSLSDDFKPTSRRELMELKHILTNRFQTLELDDVLPLPQQ